MSISTWHDRFISLYTADYSAGATGYYLRRHVANTPSAHPYAAQSNFFRASAAPWARASSFFTAMSRRIGAMPQLVQAMIFSFAT